MTFNFDSILIAITPEQKAERLKNAIYFLKKQNLNSQQINTAIQSDKYLMGSTAEEIAVAVQALQAAGDVVGVA
jgi:hypothetical protein